MSKKSGIYKITNTINGKVYIGQSSSLTDRINAHKLSLKKGTHKNVHLQRAYNKYGKEAFVFEIIEYCDESFLSEREMYYIDLYDALRKGYNQTKGGEGLRGYHHSEETKEKIGAANKIAATHNDFSDERNPNAKAVVNLNTGEIFKTIKSAAKKYGICKTAISGNLIGQRFSAGKAADGTPCVWAYYSDYKNMTQDEVDKKLLRAQRANKKENKPNAKKVVCVNTGDVFTTVTEAGEVYHVDPSAIVACCKGKLKSSGKLDGEKLVWKYAS